MAKKTRKSLYSTRVPILRKPDHDIHPDLFIVVRAGKLVVCGLIQRSRDASRTVRK
jgi:hypothetical protein